jgi:hypothetical protein
MSSLVHILPHQSTSPVLFKQPCLVCLDLRSRANDGFLITRVMIGWLLTKQHFRKGSTLVPLGNVMNCGRQGVCSWQEWDS